jgi:hypothetical protein
MEEVFEKGYDLPFKVELVTTTSSKFLEKYDLERITRGPIRLSTVNVGVESMLNGGYAKNYGMDLKDLFERLQDAGISVDATTIIGFDWHTREMLEREAELLYPLDPNSFIVATLEMQPNTPLTLDMRRQGRVLTVSPELYDFTGYQAFTHPIFKPGFEDILPLLSWMDDKVHGGEDPMERTFRFILKSSNPQDAMAQDTVRDIMGTVGRENYGEEYFKRIYGGVPHLYFPFILSTT